VIEIDYDDLKQRIRDAIRVVIQERADELGISFDECIDRDFLFSFKRSTQNSQRP
jgi:hypothetical protein